MMNVVKVHTIYGLSLHIINHKDLICLEVGQQEQRILSFLRKTTDHPIFNSLYD